MSQVSWHIYTFFFHGYKIICHDVEPESKSVRRLQCWHLSSLIQEPEAVWCESRQEVMILTQNAWMLARNGQVDYILPKQLANHHHLLSVYDMANTGDSEPADQWLHLFRVRQVFTERMSEVRKKCWDSEWRGKITTGYMLLFILLSLKHRPAPLDQFSAFFSSVKDNHLQRLRAQIQEFPGG